MVQNVLGGFPFYTLQKRLAFAMEKQCEIYAVCETMLGERGIVVALSEPHA